MNRTFFSFPLFSALPLRVVLLLFACLLCQAREPRSRAWLINYVRQPIPEAPRNDQYLAFIKRHLDDEYLGLDLHFLENGGGPNASREQTNVIGRLAFCYRTPGLRYYHDPRVLDKLNQAYLAVARHIDSEGFIKWPGDTGPFRGAHEQSWRMEPLLIGYIWVGDQFPAADREVIESALGRAAGWLSRNPDKETNNRGAVWCAITTLAGLYFERPDYLAVVDKYAGQILDGVLLEDGEVGEHTAQYGGGGPDSNYSYTGWAYAYLYRLFSGNDELDPKLERSMRWFAVYNTFRGFPVVTGASVRLRQVNPANLQDLLPAFERFSHRDAFYATLAANIMEKKEKYLPQFGYHMISPLIWAMLERGRLPSSRPWPDWYVNHTRMYDREEVRYALISRTYQTGVVFRGRHKEGYFSPLRGMQTFALGDEYPILLHTDSAHSTIKADGIETASVDTDEAFLTVGPKVGRSELATIAERRKTLWTLYAYTPVSVVVVSGGAPGGISSEWVMNRSVVSEPLLDTAGRYVSFEGRKARMYYLGGKARLSGERLEISAGAPLNATAFSDAGFRFGTYNSSRQELSFADGSGQYRLSFKELIKSDGTLNRQTRLLRAVATGR